MTPDGLQRAVRWTPDGHISVLGTGGPGTSDAYAIARDGTVAGVVTPTGGTSHAVLWRL